NNSRLDGLFDDKGNATLYQFDELDRVKLEVAADLTSKVVEYDRDDNVVRTTDANGTVAVRTFDALNRLTQVDVTPSTAWQVGGTTQQTFSYDGASRVTRATDLANGQTSVLEYAYDSLGRTLEEVQDGHVVSHVWAGDGRRLSCTYASGRRF